MRLPTANQSALFQRRCAILKFIYDFAPGHPWFSDKPISNIFCAIEIERKNDNKWFCRMLESLCPEASGSGFSEQPAL